MTNQLRWLASFPKSGNTWTRLFVASYLTGGDNINYLPHACAESDLRPYDYQCHAPRQIEKLDPAALTALKPAVLEHKRHLSWHLLKTHDVNDRVNGIELIPDRITDRAVYLVRDPRNIAPSLATHLGIENQKAVDLVCAERGVIASQEAPPLCHYIGGWSTHVDSWIKSKFPVLVLQYENLQKDPEKNFMALLKYLGFDPTTERVRHAIENTQIDRLAEKEKEEGFFDARDKDFFSRKHESLTEKQTEQIENYHEQLMEHFNYGN